MLSSERYSASSASLAEVTLFYMYGGRIPDTQGARVQDAVSAVWHPATRQEATSDHGIAPRWRGARRD